MSHMSGCDVATASFIILDEFSKGGTRYPIRNAIRSRRTIENMKNGDVVSIKNLGIFSVIGRPVYFYDTKLSAMWERHVYSIQINLIDVKGRK